MKKIRIERFTMLSFDCDIQLIENFAIKNSCTKSWIYRSILKALEQKFSKNNTTKLNIKRPKKFMKAFRQTTICFYGDKQKWMLFARMLNSELGPLIRFGFDLVQNGELELDLESSDSIKEVKLYNFGKLIKQKEILKKKGYTYHFQISVINYFKHEFWKKNPQNNLQMMKRGLANRKYPLLS